MKRILFVCTENSNRSQMAEAFSKIHGAGLVAAYSAGSQPSGRVNPRAVAAMKEKGYDLGEHRSKSLNEVPEGPYDYLITMGCGDRCAAIPAYRRDDWNLTDPRDLPPEQYNQVRDEIERRVLALMDEIRADQVS